MKATPRDSARRRTQPAHQVPHWSLTVERKDLRLRDQPNRQAGRNCSTAWDHAARASPARRRRTARRPRRTLRLVQRSRRGLSIVAAVRPPQTPLSLPTRRLRGAAPRLLMLVPSDGPETANPSIGRHRLRRDPTQALLVLRREPQASPNTSSSLVPFRARTRRVGWLALNSRRSSVPQTWGRLALSDGEAAGRRRFPADHCAE